MPTYHDVIEKKEQKDNALTVLKATSSRYKVTVVTPELNDRMAKDLEALTKSALMWAIFNDEYEQLKRDADG